MNKPLSKCTQKLFWLYLFLNFFMSLVQVSLIRIYNQLNLTGGSFNFWKEPLACCLETTEAPEATALAFSAFLAALAAF